jgi:hypothetical protein
MDDFNHLPPQDGTAAPVQKRRAPRYRVLKSGKIITSTLSGIECRLRDFSELGARLEVTGKTLLPKTFRLVITAENTIRDAELIWRHGELLGVHFLSQPKPSALRKV